MTRFLAMAEDDPLKEDRRKGLQLCRLGHWGDALPFLERALDAAPQDLELLSYKALALEGAGRPKEALRCLDRAIGAHPLDAAAWANKGNFLLRAGRWEDAVTCLDQAYRLDKRHAAALFYKGLAQDNLGRAAQARETFREFLAAAPPELEEQIAEARLRLG